MFDYIAQNPYLNRRSHLDSDLEGHSSLGIR